MNRFTQLADVNIVKDRTSTFADKPSEKSLTRCPRCGNPVCGTFTCRICGMRHSRKFILFCLIAFALVTAVWMM